jgi:hypothetical protein
MDTEGTENCQFQTLQRASSGALTPISPTLTALTDPRLATRLASRIYGCYRDNSASDPETFLTAAAAVLSRFPPEVTATVAVRLPESTKWLPSVAEIVEACDKAMQPLLAKRRRDEERERTLEIVSAQNAPTIPVGGFSIAEALRGLLDQKSPPTGNVVNPRARFTLGSANRLSEEARRLINPEPEPIGVFEP